MAKKSSRQPASKTSSAAAPAASAATAAGNRSSILRAAFSPSEYQLALFASVIQGLDSQHLRIHDIHTGALQCDHAVAPRESITCLDWGYFPSQRDQNTPKKKRKRNSNVHEHGDAVLAFGTSSSDIRMYSPEEEKVIGTLTGAHDGGIRNFKFAAGKSAEQGWSIGGDNKLVQWDLRTGKSIRTIHIPTTSPPSALSRPSLSSSSVICASQTPLILDAENPEAQPLTFPAMVNPIHSLFSSSTNYSKDDPFLAADSGRYVTVFDPKTKGIAHSLIAENDVSALSLYSHAVSSSEDGAQTKQVLAVLVNDGTIELFNRPFLQLGNSKSTSLKARAKQMTRKADAVVKIVNAESRRGVSVVQADFQGPELFVAWAEGGVNVMFERVNWLSKDTEELALSGVTEVTARKSASVLHSAAVKEVRNASKSHVNENNVVVDSGAFADDVEMNGTHADDVDAVSISDEGDSSEDEEKQPKQRQTNKTLTNGVGSKEDVEMQDAASGAEEDDEDAGGEPSFGELAQRNAAIDVEAELEDNTGAGALVPGTSSKKVYQIPSGVSLSTVLSQALKTNDVEMLESCFHTSDLNIVRATIQRLDSTLAGTLLQKVSERMASRPGRYGHLLVWVQWTCIAHGGAIAGNADILKRMTSLHKVMDQRSRSLPSLLLLKGKLDMLDAQVNLRQSMSDSRKHEADDEEILENVTHYAGVNDDDSSEAGHRRKRKTITSTNPDGAGSEDGDDLENGFGSDLDNEDEDDGDASEEDADEDADLVDIEAEEYAGSSDEEESLEGHEDDDDDEEEDDESDAGSDMADFIADSEEDMSDEEAIPAPPQKKAKLGGKSRKGGRS